MPTKKPIDELEVNTDGSLAEALDEDSQEYEMPEFAFDVGDIDNSQDPQVAREGRYTLEIVSALPAHVKTKAEWEGAGSKDKPPKYPGLQRFDLLIAIVGGHHYNGETLYKRMYEYPTIPNKNLMAEEDYAKATNRIRHFGEAIGFTETAFWASVTELNKLDFFNGSSDQFSLLSEQQFDVVLGVDTKDKIFGKRNFIREFFVK